jgi:DNA-binding NarL/FixJ family response regulator
MRTRLRPFHKRNAQLTAPDRTQSYSSDTPVVLTPAAECGDGGLSCPLGQPTLRDIQDQINLVLVDDRPLVRSGVRRTLESEWDMRVVGEANSIEDALEFCRANPDAVVVLSLDLPGARLLRAIQALRRQGNALSVIVLSPRDTDDELYQAVVAGATGHVAEASEPHQLAETVRRAAAGEEPISRQIARRPLVSQRVMDTYRHLAQLAVARPEGDIPLNARERKILGYVAQGMTNRQIGRQLGLSENTIKADLSGVMRQLGLRGRTEAVVLAVRRGWIASSEPAPSGARTARY